MLTNKWIGGNGDLTDAFALRRVVFVEEQNVDEAHEFDELDGQSMHVVLYDDGKPIATGRVWHDGKTWRIGRCCVIKEERGGGIGDLLIKLLILKAFEFNPTEVRIHAQVYAEGFYKRYGFERVSEEYEEEGIPHVTMRMTKETMVFPTDCGNDKHYEDFFEAAPKGK